MIIPKKSAISADVLYNTYLNKLKAMKKKTNKESISPAELNLKEISQSPNQEHALKAFVTENERFYKNELDGAVQHIAQLQFGITKLLSILATIDMAIEPIVALLNSIKGKWYIKWLLSSSQIDSINAFLEKINVLLEDARKLQDLKF